MLFDRGQRDQQVGEIALVSDIFFAMAADDEIAVVLQRELLQDRRFLDLRLVVTQYLAHRRTGLDHRVWRASLLQEVAARVLGIGQIDVGDVIDDLAIDLLRHALVEAAVAGLHVEDRDLAPLGRDRGQTAVGVAEQKQCVRLLLLEYRIDPRDHIADGGRGSLARGIQKTSGLRISSC